MMNDSLHFNGHFSRCTLVSRYQKVSILDFTGTKGNGGGVTTAAIRRAKLQSNRHHQQKPTPNVLQAGRPSCRPTNSARALYSIYFIYLFIFIVLIMYLECVRESRRLRANMPHRWCAIPALRAVSRGHAHSRVLVVLLRL